MKVTSARSSLLFFDKEREHIRKAYHENATHGKKAPSIFLKFKHFVKRASLSLFFKRLLFKVLFLQNAALITSLTAYLICIKSFDSISKIAVLLNDYWNFLSVMWNWKSFQHLNKLGIIEIMRIKLTLQLATLFIRIRPLFSSVTISCQFFYFSLAFLHTPYSWLE